MSTLRRRAEGASRSFFARRFPLLAAHFFARFFDSELVAGDGDNSLSIGGVFAILAVPGAFAPLFLFAKYSSFLAWLRGHPRLDVWQMSLSDQYLLITYAMTVAGVVTVIKWDSLFPDRRDFAALAPLPLNSAWIFYAKVAALAALLLFLIVDVNGPATLVFPMVFLSGYGTFSEYVRFTAIHALAVFAASCFTFLFFLALSGLFLVALPPRWFARVSRYVRTASVIALLSLLLTSFAVSEAIMSPHVSAGLMLLPPVWFVGLSRALFGQPAYPVFTELAARAVIGLAIALVVAALAYALSYRRYFVRIRESIDAPPGEYSRIAALLWRGIERALPGSRFEQACGVFALKTLCRSEKHWLMLGAYLGLALTIAAETLAGTLEPAAGPPPAAVLAVPLIVIFFMISGLRFVFAAPSELRANWVFRVCGDAPRHAGSRVARAVMLALALPFLLFVCLPAYWAVYGTLTGIAHIAFLLLITAILADISLSGYRSIPFTCSWAPGKNNGAFAVALYGGAFFIVVSMVSSLEHWMLRGAAQYAAAVVVIAIAWRYWRHETRDSEAGDTVLYEDRRAPAVQTLDLS